MVEFALKWLSDCAETIRCYYDDDNETQFLVCNQSLEIQKDNGMAAMLDDKTKRSVIQHGCHTIVFWISRDWLQTKNLETYVHVS